MVRAAALAALGVAAKLFPLFLLPLLALRALLERRFVAVAAMAGAAIAAWTIVNLPVAAFAFTNWSEFYAFSGQRTGTPASVWELTSTMFPATLATDVEYWPTQDPVGTEGRRELQLDAYRATRDELMRKIRARFAPPPAANE